jgi:beta-xylosidase
MWNWKSFFGRWRLGAHPFAKPQAAQGACAILLLLIAFHAHGEVPPTRQTYHNPLNVDIADPHVIRSDGLYWLYGTSAPDGFKTWSSSDLIHWDPHGYVFKRTRDSWGEIFFWAPCVIEHGGKFFLYYSALGKVPGGQKHLRICVAASDSPAGPFKDLKAPLLEIGKSVIDAEVFIDDDGKAYLYYALDNSENALRDPATGKEIRQSHIYVVQLGDDLISIRGQPVFCTKPDQPWEGGTVNEGPLLLKHGATYIMMYSAHAFFEPEYCVGYAIAKSPLGPWSKAAENPILCHTPDISGPGHNCVIASPDGKELFCVYHVHKDKVPGGKRQLAIDRMKIIDGPDGSVKLKILGPTSATQPAP